MKTGFKYFERVIVSALIAMLSFVVLVSTIELGYLIIEDLLTPPLFWMEVEDLLEVFGFFLLILIGVELLESIRAYLVENVVHVEIVLKVALIAIARKVIIIEVDAYESLTIIGIAAMILAIAGAYFVVKKAGVAISRRS